MSWVNQTWARAELNNKTVSAAVWIFTNIISMLFTRLAAAVLVINIIYNGWKVGSVCGLGSTPMYCTDSDNTMNAAH